MRFYPIDCHISVWSNIFDHVENIFNLVKIFLNQQMNYLGMKEYLHFLLSFSAKFEAMLFALCKNEDNNTASMRIFLQVCIFFFFVFLCPNIAPFTLYFLQNENKLRFSNFGTRYCFKMGDCQFLLL